MGQERDHVMPGLALDRVDAGHVERYVACLLPNGFRGLLRDDAELRHGVGGMRLDLEPDAETGLGLPDGSHLGTGIARNHRITLSGLRREVAYATCRRNPG